MSNNLRNAKSDDEMLDDSDEAVERAMTFSTDDRLRLFIERIERLEEERKAIGDDIRDAYSEAKGQGYDPKIMRRIVALRKMDPQARSEMEMVLETYKSALGLS